MAHIVLDARLINSSTGRYIERLVHYLEQIDTTNKYTIIVPSKDKTFYTPNNSNFSVVVSDHPIYSLSEQTGFKKLLDGLKPDLVHFCMPQQPILYGGKSVTTVHDLTLLKTYNSDKNWLVFHIKQLVGKFVFKQIAKTNIKIITPSEYTKKEYVQFAPKAANKTVVTYEAAETPDLENTKPYDDLPFKQFIMYVGQQSDYKNIRRLADAHQKLLSNYPDLGLVLVGKKVANIKANEIFFDKMGYRNVHFTDFIADEQRDWLYQHTLAYVFPSLMEGFGLPGLEAMASGAPVVSSNATCLPEIYGDAAIYFNPIDTDDMAEKIDAVISSEALRTELVEKGNNQVAKYSWQHMAEQTHEVYLEALGK